MPKIRGHYNGKRAGPAEASGAQTTRLKDQRYIEELREAGEEEERSTLCKRRIR
jgi:hypothetical protein